MSIEHYRTQYKPEVSKLVENHAAFHARVGIGRPFHATPPALSHLTWAERVLFVKERCDGLLAQYTTYTDKRTSQARKTKSSYIFSSAQLHYYRIYAAEQVAAPLT
jgi:hypothetical protein